MAGGNGSPDYGSAENMALGFGVFAIVVVLQRFGKGFIKNSAILIALVVGYVIAGFMGMLDFSSIKEASWVSVPMPWQFDVKFSLSASVSFIILFIYSGLQIIGNGNGVTIACFDRSATDKETSGGIMADAVGSLFAAIFNCLDVDRDLRVKRYLERDELNYKNVAECIRRIDDDDNRAFKGYEDWVQYVITTFNSEYTTRQVEKIIYGE